MFVSKICICTACFYVIYSKVYMLLIFNILNVFLRDISVTQAALLFKRTFFFLVSNSSFFFFFRQQFVSDRRIDDDLGRTTRFTYDSDHLAAVSINNLK